jgi:hypothetical protein
MKVMKLVKIICKLQAKFFPEIKGLKAKDKLNKPKTKTLFLAVVLKIFLDQLKEKKLKKKKNLQ